MQLRPKQLQLLNVWRQRLLTVVILVLAEVGIFVALRRTSFAGRAVDSRAPAATTELARLKHEDKVLDAALASHCAERCNDARRQMADVPRTAAAQAAAADRNLIWQAVQPFVRTAMTAAGGEERYSFSFLWD
eukprot:SAG31_NODE_428_length_15809_cov_9.783959_1_plen_133_part_00